MTSFLAAVAGAVIENQEREKEGIVIVHNTGHPPPCDEFWSYFEEEGSGETTKKTALTEIFCINCYALYADYAEQSLLTKQVKIPEERAKDQQEAEHIAQKVAKLIARQEAEPIAHLLSFGIFAQKSRFKMT
ncbi:hypothetical protein B9Z55_000527 [Caenorhabditis nigoni]|uniref:Uncharacterized protein n=1 Tax=Caenorhabditis nigoni TaxID=1611254 RepID=A0A2G5VTE7_9PELO|nr:hypothetical protein B9Z55_000527 [Caenorhabditis nigoni]